MNATPSAPVPVSADPVAEFLVRAVDGLRLLQSAQLPFVDLPDHRRLLARHTPALPQAPLKPRSSAA